MIPHNVGEDNPMQKLSSSHYVTDCHVGRIKRFLITIFIAVFNVGKQP
jgi:hypothetical protein